MAVNDKTPNTRYSDVSPGLRRSTSPSSVVTSTSSARGLFARAKRVYNFANGAEDLRSGFELLRQAAELGHAGAHEWLGYVYDYGMGTRPNRRHAPEHYKIAAYAGRANAEYHVGIFYHMGRGVARDYHAAMDRLQKAATHGDAAALYWMGHCYVLGRGVPKDEARGFALILEAANRG